MKIKKLIEENLKSFKTIKYCSIQRIERQFPDSNFPIFAYLCTNHQEDDKEEQSLDNFDKSDIDDSDFACSTSLGSTTFNEMKSFSETSTLDVLSNSRLGHC